MMRIILAALILLVYKVPAQLVLNPLEEASAKHSRQLFSEYFEKWHQSVKPTDSAVLAQMNDTLKQAYQVFTAFYKPVEKKRNNSFYQYKRTKYLVIQDSLAVFISKGLLFQTLSKDTVAVNNATGFRLKLLWNKNIKKWAYCGWDSTGRGARLCDTISTFRPMVYSGGKEVLYITQPYKQQMDEYLNALGPIKTSPAYPDNIDPIKVMKYASRRRDRLARYVKAGFAIVEGSIGATYRRRDMVYDWQFPSYPTVSSISFDNELQYALVEFDFSGWGGVSLLKREKDVWKELIYFSPPD